MNDARQRSRLMRRAFALVTALALVTFTGLLLILTSSTSNSPPPSADASYLSELAAALADADPAAGAQLVQSFDCAACHLTGDGSVSPLFTNIGSHAAARRPPLSAQQYLYEAIVFPAAHLVPGYTNSMPLNYADRLTPAQIGHIIAYLLTLDSTDESS